MKLKGIPVKGLKIGKSGKAERVVKYPSVSARIAAKKSKKIKVVKGLR